MSGLVEGDNAKVRLYAEIYLSNGSVAGLGCEHLMPHGLDVSEATLQGAGHTDRRGSGDATSELRRPDCARHRVRTAEQEICFLVCRMGLLGKTSLPRFAHSVQKQQTAGTQDRFCLAQLDLSRRALLEKAGRRHRILRQGNLGHLFERSSRYTKHRRWYTGPRSAYQWHPIKRPFVVRPAFVIWLHRKGSRIGDENVLHL